jgi:hypothetical protein
MARQAFSKPDTGYSSTATIGYEAGFSSPASAGPTTFCRNLRPDTVRKGNNPEMARLRLK